MSCSRCKYSRWIVAQHKESKQVYGFRCGCDSVLSDKISLWNDRMAKDYEVDFTIKFPESFKAKAANDKIDDDYEQIPF